MNNTSKDLIEKFKELKAPQSVTEKVMLTVTENTVSEEKPLKFASGKRFGFKKAVAILCTAVMLSLVVVAGAVKLSGQNTFVFRMLGEDSVTLTSDDIMYMPKVTALSDNIIIESIIVYKENGENIFRMMISHKNKGSGNYNPVLPDFEQTSTKDFSANIEVTFKDGTSVMLDDMGSHSSRGTDENGKLTYFGQYYYGYKNFPDETEFTVTDKRGQTADISLSKPSEDFAATDNGIKRIGFFAAEGSPVLLYNVEMLTPTLLETDSRFKGKIVYSLGGYRSDGSKITYESGITGMITGGSVTGAKFNAQGECLGDTHLAFGEARISDDNYQVGLIREKIKKITINQIEAHVWISGAPLFDIQDFTYTVPLPKEGERIEFETPYYLDTICEFEIYISAIEYKDNKLYIDVLNDDIKYSGFEDVSDIQLGLRNADGYDGTTGAWYISDGFTYYMSVGPHDGDTIDIQLDRLQYYINGLWEIDFN